MLVRALCAAVLGALSLGIAACGEDTEAKNDYVSKVNAAQNRFAQSVGKIDTSAASPEDLQKSLDSLSGEVKKTADAIAQADPPEDVKSANARLVSILNGYAEDLGQVAEAIGEGGTTTQQLKSAQRIVTATEKAQTAFDQAINQINSQLKE
jgi:uncharacterized protein YoxC